MAMENKKPPKPSTKRASAEPSAPAKRPRTAGPSASGRGTRASQESFVAPSRGAASPSASRSTPPESSAAPARDVGSPGNPRGSQGQLTSRPAVLARTQIGTASTPPARPSASSSGGQSTEVLAFFRKGKPLQEDIQRVSLDVLTEEFMSSSSLLGDFAAQQAVHVPRSASIFQELSRRFSVLENKHKTLQQQHVNQAEARKRLETANNTIDRLNKKIGDGAKAQAEQRRMLDKAAADHQEMLRQIGQLREERDGLRKEVAGLPARVAEARAEAKSEAISEFRLSPKFDAAARAAEQEFYMAGWEDALKQSAEAETPQTPAAEMEPINLEEEEEEGAAMPIEGSSSAILPGTGPPTETTPAAEAQEMPSADTATAPALPIEIAPASTPAAAGPSEGQTPSAIPAEAPAPSNPEP